MGDYSTYIDFDDPNKRESRTRVYAGRAASKNKAMELAYELLYEEGGGVEAVRVIDSTSQDETFIRRIGSEDDGPTKPRKQPCDLQQDGGLIDGKGYT